MNNDRVNELISEIANVTKKLGLLDGTINELMQEIRDLKSALRGESTHVDRQIEAMRFERNVKATPKPSSKKKKTNHL